MEYEFRRDLYDQPEARVEMEQWLFGRWLSEAIASDLQLAEQILQQAQSMLQQRSGHFQWHNAEFQLRLEPDLAEVCLHSAVEPDELEEGYGLDGELSEAGLEDFIGLLQGWTAYLKG